MLKKLKDADGNEFDLESIVEGLISKNGSPAKAVETLVNENYELRQRNRELRSSVEKNSVPEGSVVLDKEAYSLYEAYKALGKPDELKSVITERDTFKTELVEVKTAQTVRQAAEIHGVKHTVLGDLVKAHNLVLEIGERDVAKDGKTVKEPTAFVKDDKGVATPLSDVLESRFKDYMPALKPAGDQQTGTPWVTQQGSAGSQQNNNSMKDVALGVVAAMYTPRKS